jgi:type II secretory pathway pseudopilin PulG
LEVMMVLLVLVLAGVLLFTALGRVRYQRNAGRLIADLQAFATVFQTYHRQSRAWPASTNGENRLPRELETALEETHWDEGSPFGGSYGWDSRGAVVLTAYAPAFPLKLTRAEFLAIDRQMDDGDLATGRLRTGFNGWPVYFVGGKP